MIWTRPSLELKISWAMVPLGVATKWSLPTPWPVTVPREGSSKTSVYLNCLARWTFVLLQARPVRCRMPAEGSPSDKDAACSRKLTRSTPRKARLRRRTPPTTPPGGRPARVAVGAGQLDEHAAGCDRRRGGAAGRNDPGRRRRRRRRLGRRMRVRVPRCGRTAHGRVACGHGYGLVRESGRGVRARRRAGRGDLVGPATDGRDPRAQRCRVTAA
jgi:hypothetical protein